MEFSDIAAAVGGAAVIIGFVGTWIKIGVSKGRSDADLDAVKKTASGAAASAAAIAERMDRKLSELDARIDNIKTENAETLARLSTNIDWIKDSLGEIKQKLGAGRT